MIWKTVPSYPFLEVSDTGRVRKIKNKKEYIGAMHPSGYKFIHAGHESSTYRLAVHRLICEAFHGVSDLTVDHKDRNKLNNSEDNLQWLSASDNASNGSLGIKQPEERVLRRAISQSCENNGQALLTNEQVKEIRRLLMLDMQCSSIALQYGVSRTTISDIKTGRTFGNLK